MNAIDYFTEKWLDKNKPFKHNEYYANKKKIPIESEANRFISKQPIEFVSEDNKLSYNKRKLNELPFLISRLGAENAVYQMCKYVIFDYEFLHKKFVLSDPDTIMKEIENVTAFIPELEKGSQIKNIGHEMQLFALIFLSCMYTLEQNPDNCSLQITARTLLFYKGFEFYRKLIDEADKYSAKHCALIAPYQYLHPPGLGSLFTLDTHKSSIETTIFDSSFFITCSDRMNIFQMSRMKSLGDIKFPLIKSTDKYLKALVYLKQNTDYQDDELRISNFDGGYVLMTTTTIFSLRFDGQELFVKEFDKLILKNMFIVPTKYLIIQYENQKYFDVYNLFTGKLITSEKFDKKIDLIECSIRNDAIIYFDEYKPDQNLLVAFEKGEILKLNISDDNIEGVLYKLFKINYKIPESGIDVHSMGFFIKKDKFSNKNKYVVTFCDGGFCLIDDFDFENCNELIKSHLLVKYARPIPKEKNGDEIELLKLLCFTEESILFKTKKGLYMWKDFDETVLRFIPGNYNLAKYEKGTMIVAASKGTVFIFQLGNLVNGKKEHQVYENLQFDAHYDDINFLEYSGISFLFIK